MPVEILLSYAENDKEAALQLVRHMVLMERSGKIAIWHRGLCVGGANPDEQWRYHSKRAAIILLLISLDLEIDRSDDIQEALRLRAEGTRVVPILWREVDLKHACYKDLKMLPDGRVVEERRDRDRAWVEVVTGIRGVVESVEAEGGRGGAPVPALFGPATTPLPVAAPESPRRILFLAANPSDTTRLRLGEERREIDQRIQKGKYRDRLELADAWAITRGDLIETLLRYKPTVLHFSGHGGEQGQIILNDESGRAAAVSAEALADLFRIFSAKGLRCVLLNACYSAVQAEAIAQHIDCVIGISGTIPDPTALAFASGFYAGLAAGESMQLAFELGRVQIGLTSLPKAALEIYSGPRARLTDMRLF